MSFQPRLVLVYIWSIWIMHIYMYVDIILKLFSFMYFAKYFACCAVAGSSQIKSIWFLTFFFRKFNFAFTFHILSFFFFLAGETLKWSSLFDIFCVVVCNFSHAASLSVSEQSLYLITVTWYSSAIIVCSLSLHSHLWLDSSDYRALQWFCFAVFSLCDTRAAMWLFHYSSNSLS